jgi:hypothetical protein
MTENLMAFLEAVRLGGLNTVQGYWSSEPEGVAIIFIVTIMGACAVGFWHQVSELWYDPRTQTLYACAISYNMPGIGVSLEQLIPESLIDLVRKYLGPVRLVEHIPGRNI